MDHAVKEDLLDRLAHWAAGIDGYDTYDEMIALCAAVQNLIRSRGSLPAKPIVPGYLDQVIVEFRRDHPDVTDTDMLDLLLVYMTGLNRLWGAP